MEKENEQADNAELILPVVCHNCGETLELSVGFSLMAPKIKDETIKNTKPNDNTIEITEA